MQTQVHSVCASLKSVVKGLVAVVGAGNVRGKKETKGRERERETRAP